MAFFQNAVLNKYLKAQDAAVIQAAYAKFKAHFHNPVIQENIRNSKEEQYQGEFLIDLFVNVLGYTKNPQPDFNLTTEYKNVKDSKKADGAIILPSPPGRGAGGEGLVIAVIELKGTDTTDLGKIETQAFGYKNNQPQCVYIITSNFEKLRFYIDNAIEHIEFNLFTLTENDFQLLWLCLAYSNIEKGIPKKIKDESLGQEDIITKKLYNDYSLFKRELHQNLVALNPQHNPLELFNKSQKLLDRFLFLFFAEDRQLLPPNAVRNVMSEWKQLKELDEYKPLYEQFKKHFNYLNTGFKNSKYEIFAYNGGLFKTDDLLDNLKIEDELLYRHTLKLSEYDFASEVDVNILGHIFENSLNELDEIKAQLAGEVIDKSKTKRKKDGVFYTPKYITKYIVENTVGKLCMEKKAELQLNEEEYTTDKKRQQKTRQALLDKLTAYRNWLLQLTICDPACGSGAFLNQALDFLINEHRYVDELQAKLFGDALVLSDMENSILENNLFGVDLNEESVEIAKLSLWLRTAQPNRKLNDLNNNIKCGNSLIDDPAVAGDKAFNWEKEFPQVFAKGGFDVVIGNPPYVRVQNLNYLEVDYYKSNYDVAHLRIDISLLFFEKGLKILRKNQLLGFITTIQFINAEYGRKARQLLLSVEIQRFIDYDGSAVFNGATTYPGIVILKKSNPKPFTYTCLTSVDPTLLFALETSQSINVTNFEMQLNSLSEEVWVLKNSTEITLLDKLNSCKIKLKDFANPCTGLTTGMDNILLLNSAEAEDRGFEKELLLPVVRGRDIRRGLITHPSDVVIYPYELVDNKTSLIAESELARKYPKVYSYLLTEKTKLGKRKDSRRLLAEGDDWYKLVRKGRLDLFQAKKILTPGISRENRFAIDHEGFTYLCGGAGVFGIVQEKFSDYFLLAILNSKVVQFYLHSISTKKQGGYFSYLNSFLEQIPIPEGENFKLHELAKEIEQLILKKTNSLNAMSLLIQNKYSIVSLSSNLQNWHELEFGEFLKELKKAKVQLSLAEEAEWMSYFNSEKQKAQALKTQIAQTDKEINRMVYELYGLTEEEIKIVEGS